MKRGILINIILIFILFSIPKVQKQEIITEEKEEQIIQVTSRSGEERKVIKNYELTLETDLRTKSNVAAEEYNLMLQDTGLAGLGQAFFNAEKEYGINGLYLMGLACLESGYGRSGYATERNNLFGWNAVDSNPDKAGYFESKEQCIDYVASKLKANYLTEGGAYFEGYTAKDIDKHYCTDQLHANKIINIVDNLKEVIE